MHILNVVGARPNLMKIAPLIKEIQRHPNLEQTLLHTGQHYDANLSQIFFDELDIPRPDIYLGVGSGSHAEQTARIMIDFEKILLTERPDLVIVVGDVNSTLACAVTAAKLRIPVAHIEAGLRSYDRNMPEEINRLVTDAIADFLFTTSHGASENLRREGITSEKIFFVGNLMIDTLNKHRQCAEALGTPARLGFEAGNYALLTLHRPSNVDDSIVLAGILDALTALQRELPIIFPAHPRTMARIADFGYENRLAAAPNLHMVKPLGYLAFLDLMMHAQMMLTDSGGVQEETTFLGVPCLTLRENTERPVTITEGSNLLIGNDPALLLAAAQRILAGETKSGRTPELWDGRTAERIVRILPTLL